MSIEQRTDTDRLTLILTGRLETTTAPLLEKIVDEIGQEIHRLVMDMQGLEFVSSAGLRVLLAANKKMKAKGGSMTVKNANEDIQEIFRMTGFEDILQLE